MLLLFFFFEENALWLERASVQTIQQIFHLTCLPLNHSAHIHGTKKQHTSFCIRPSWLWCSLQPFLPLLQCSHFFTSRFTQFIDFHIWLRWTKTTEFQFQISINSSSFVYMNCFFLNFKTAISGNHFNRLCFNTFDIFILYSRDSFNLEERKSPNRLFIFDP